MLLLGWWSVARLLAKNLPYARDAIFAPVSQAAQRVVAVDAFGKAQSLSLRFHQTRRTGALQRVIDRGAGALDTLIRFLVFNIGPTLIELALASWVLATFYGGWSALAAVLTVILYGLFTYWITTMRVVQQRRLNEADTELRARAVDSLNNFETVKVLRRGGARDAALRLRRAGLQQARHRHLALACPAQRRAGVHHEPRPHGGGRAGCLGEPRRRRAGRATSPPSC